MNPAWGDSWGDAWADGSWGSAAPAQSDELDGVQVRFSGDRRERARAGATSELAEATAQALALVSFRSRGFSTASAALPDALVLAKATALQGRVAALAKAQARHGDALMALEPRVVDHDLEALVLLAEAA